MLEQEKPNRKPKYLALYDDLCKKISNGEYGADTYLPPEREISELYNVGRITVRNALDILTKEGKIRRIRGAGNLVLFSNNRESYLEDKTIAFVTSGDYGEKLRQPFIELLFHNIETVCRSNGIKIFNVTLKKEDSMLEMLLDKAVCAGIIFIGYVAEKFIQAAKQAEMPIVLISNAFEGLVSINASNVDGCFDATEHLIKTGSSKIAFISGIQSHHNSILRQTGYKRALLCNGLSYDESLVKDGDWGYESGYDAMQALLAQHSNIDGVVAANDMMACGAIKALTQASLSIPTDVQVFGFDNIELGWFAPMALSTVGIDTQFLSMLAIGLLENQTNGYAPKGNTLLAANLVLRETTRSM